MQTAGDRHSAHHSHTMRILEVGDLHGQLARMHLKLAAKAAMFVDVNRYDTMLERTAHFLSF